MGALFPFMQTLSQTDIANLALLRIGQRKCTSINDPVDQNAVACLVAWPQAFAEVARETAWNCLKARQYLSPLAPNAQNLSQWPYLPASVPWVPGAVHVIGDYVTFGQPSYLYQCLIANTASANFTIDLTLGYWFQTTYFYPAFYNPGGNAEPLYEWNWGYQLPNDFIMGVELNGQNIWRGMGVGTHYEIFEKQIYTNAPYANLKYIQYQPDTTNFDPMFTGALDLMLASRIVSGLRNDDGKMMQQLLLDYEAYMHRARTMNANESKPRRYNIVSESRFVGSRRRSTNG